MGGGSPLLDTVSPDPAHPPALTELRVGRVGEEDDARAGGYGSCCYHGVHELRVEGHISGPEGVAGIVAAEDNPAAAVVVVLVPGIDDDGAIRELVGLRGEKRSSGEAGEAQEARAGCSCMARWHYGVAGKSLRTPDLALVGVEIMLVFGLAEGDAAHSSPVVPGSTVVVAEETKDPIALQRPVSTHNEPALVRLPLFL